MAIARKTDMLVADSSWKNATPKCLRTHFVLTIVSTLLTLNFRKLLVPEGGIEPPTKGL